MAIYLICFIISCLLFKVSDKTKGNTRSFIIIIALLIPCILAGVRDVEIGTDVQVYVEPLFLAAENAQTFDEYYGTSWFRIWKYNYVNDFEIGFSSAVYLITKIFGSIQWVLFFIHLAIVLLIYLGLKKYKELDGKIWFGMLIFYLMFYNISLNIMRQYISIAILFYAISCLINNKKLNMKANIQFYFLLIIATLFHKSSLIGIIIYIVYIILNSEYEKNKIIRISNISINANKFFSLLSISIGMLIVVNSNFLLSILNVLGLEYYTNYINGNVSLLISKIFKVFPIIFVYLVVYKSFLKNVKDSWFYILMFILGTIIIVQLSSVNVYAERIGYLFQIFNIVSIPLLCSNGKKKSTNRFDTIFIIIYLILYWYYYFVSFKMGETIPYIPFWK